MNIVVRHHLEGKIDDLREPFDSAIKTHACRCGGPIERVVVTDSAMWAGCIPCYEKLSVDLLGIGVEHEVGEIGPVATA